MPTCSACAHFTQYTGTTRGACDYQQAETFTYNQQCQDGFDPKRKEAAAHG